MEMTFLNEKKIGTAPKVQSKGWESHSAVSGILNTQKSHLVAYLPSFLYERVSNIPRYLFTYRPDIPSVPGFFFLHLSMPITYHMGGVKKVSVE